MIKDIKQLDAGLYADAAKTEAAHGLAYVNINAHLAAMAANGDLEDGLIREDLLRAGVSPVRQLLAGAGITLGGMRASTADVFFRGSKNYVPGADVLAPALMQEMFEGALGIHAAGDLSFTSNPGTAGDTVYPLDTRNYTDQRLPIPSNIVGVDDLVSVTFGIDSDGYKTARVTADQRGDQNEMNRVAEGADLPLYSISTADRSVRIYKRGARIKWTYEAMRRQRLNQLQMLIQELAYSEDLKRRKDALAVAVNGDGNGNGMVVASSNPASWTIQNVDEWALEVAYNASLGFNRVAGDLTEVKSVRALRYSPNNGVVLNPEQLAMYGANYQMPDGTPLLLAPKGSVLEGAKTLLAWNTARALEQVIENGSQIQEQERIIQNQTGQMTMSINLGYGKPYDNSFQAIVHQ
ncbi:hypothetical protein [Deinococcus navajonensis]|uniref:HK97 family phage major capsid protein n=1 Tax=Deinococcus navajonensis TaxID=309884 RepID=A0ABV8XT08_9DEIO